MLKIELEKLRIPENLVLIKPDPDFEFVTIHPEDGEDVKIWIGYDPETMAQHYGVTGKVLKLPEQLSFRLDALEKAKKGMSTHRTPGEAKLINDITTSSLDYEVENELQEGDKVWFDYLNQISVFDEKRLVEVEGHGICFFVRYDTLYCYERDNEIKLLNGWVWIERLKADDITPAGLHLPGSRKETRVPKKARIVKASVPIKRYKDKYHSEEPVELKEGQEILFDDRFGHPVEYELHRTIHNKEVLCIRRKNMYAIL